MEIDTSTTAGKIDVMSAFERGEKIHMRVTCAANSWTSVCSTNPNWDWVNYKYRIAPKPDPYAELKAAFSRGDVIEYLHKYSNGWKIATDPAWFPDCAYRIKPTPKRVPLCANDSKNIIAFRSVSGTIYIPTCIGSDKIYFLDASPFFKSYMQLKDEGWEYSNNRINWLPCSKLEEAK